jgi:hypothetical protein
MYSKILELIEYQYAGSNTFVCRHTEIFIAINRTSELRISLTPLREPQVSHPAS